MEYHDTYYRAKFISSSSRNDNAMSFVADVIKSVEQESIEKEKNMDKDYIVIHEKGGQDINKTGIIYKSKIAGILRCVDGKAIILLDNNYSLYCEDSYADIVKQLV